MASSRIKNTFRNTFFGLGYNLYTLVGQFVIRTLLIWKMGNEYVGLNSLFTSILGVLNMTELGVGSAMCYSMYKPIAENNQGMINALAKLYRKLCRIIGTIILVMGLFLLPFVEKLIKGNAPDDINVYILYLIFLADTLVSYFMFSYQTAVIDAYQRNDLQSKILFISKSFMYIIQIATLLLTSNYWLYIIVLPISSVIENFLRSIFVKKIFPQVKCEGEVEPELKQEIKKKVFALFGHRLNGTVIASADNIVLSAFLGLNTVGLYNNYYYILSAVATPFRAFYGAVRSSIGNSYIEKSVEYNYELFRNVIFAIKWGAAWFSICLVCLYQPFIELWLGKESLLEFSTVVLLAFMFYEWRIFDCLTVFKDAAGLWWEDRFRPYIACVTNLVINIVLVNIWGVNGVILSTILSRMVISLPWVVKILFQKVFHEGMAQFWIRYVIDLFVLCGGTIITFFVCRFMGNSLLGLIKGMIICSIIPNVFFLVIYGRCKEFHYLKGNVLKRMIKHR